MTTKEERTMTRPLKIIFLLLWAAALILAPAAAIRAKGLQQLPSPPTIRSVSPNADGSVDIAVESCNNMLPEGGTTPYSLLEYYPRRGQFNFFLCNIIPLMFEPFFYFLIIVVVTCRSGV